MIEWKIAMGDREDFLENVELASIRVVTDPIRDHLAMKLAPIAEEERDLAIIFVVEDDRSLSIRLHGESLVVNRARDILGEEEEIGPLLA